MATEASQPLKITLVAGADLSAKQYHFVKMHTDGTVIAVAAITDIPIGVLQNDPTSGQEAEITVIGVSKVVADGTLDENNVIGTSADGQADAIAAGTDTTVYIVGRAMKAAAAGDITTVLINCAAPARAA